MYAISKNDLINVIDLNGAISIITGVPIEDECNRPDQSIVIPRVVGEVIPDHTNCFGHATGINGSVQPCGRFTPVDAATGLGYSCSQSSDECIPGKCEEAMVIYLLDQGDFHVKKHVKMESQAKLLDMAQLEILV